MHYFSKATDPTYFSVANTLAYFPSRTVIKHFGFTGKVDGSIDPG